MLLIWGKRSYGSVEKVGNISVKTVFGHFWYLPLFPMTSYYVDTKSKAAYELNGLHLRSVLFGYLRVWLPVIAFIGLIMHSEGLTAKGVAALAGIAFIATYLYDRKSRQQEVTELRLMMQRHFGVALDPHACLASLQQEIDSKTQASSMTPLEETWYKHAIKDLFTDKQSLELAMLRARCDQHDKELQQLVLQKIPKAA